MKDLVLPLADGPWSWRRFNDLDDAQQFHRRLEPGNPPPVQLTEALLAPDGTVLQVGTWIVAYRPIISCPPRCHGLRRLADDELLKDERDDCAIGEVGQSRQRSWSIGRCFLAVGGRFP